MNVHRVLGIANEELERHGLAALGWRARLDHARRRFGQCRFRTRTISISAPLAELNDEARVRNTVLHEIAHALVGPAHGHDYVWHQKAREIGCDGKSRYDSQVVVTPKGRFAATCSGCKQVFYKHRLSRSRGVCTKCYRALGRSHEAFEKLQLKWVDTTLSSTVSGGKVLTGGVNMAEQKEGVTTPTGINAPIKTTINLLGGTFEVVATFDTTVEKYVGSVVINGETYVVRGKNRHSLVSGAHAKVKSILGKVKSEPNS